MKIYHYLIILLLIAHPSKAQTPSLAKHLNLNENGVALSGYDPVSYFNSSGPQKGKQELRLKYHDAVYFFTTAANLDMFRTNPSKYEPAYGGWCAYAMGKSGDKVEIDPKTFKIIDGKLFLFYNAFFNNTLPKWNEDEKILHHQADLNWNKIISK